MAAVSELQQRVDDWKGHKLDHFGDLLLHGTYTVIKGEGSKEVDREVSVLPLSSSIPMVPDFLLTLAPLAG